MTLFGQVQRFVRRLLSLTPGASRLGVFNARPRHWLTAPTEAVKVEYEGDEVRLPGVPGVSPVSALFPPRVGGKKADTDDLVTPKRF